MEAGKIQPVVKAVTTPEQPKRVAVSPLDIASSVDKKDVKSLGKVAESIQLEPESREAIEEKVSELNSFVQNIQRGIQFTLQEETGRSIITVIDRETGEEIRKFPSDQILALAEHFSETVAMVSDNNLGLLVNGKA
ncbi:hypothetical protein A9Q82_05000 [Cycloclasticus sp. 46_120_T64]|nr:hypothetical protein A9Q82_05000 [Cycloclasticus sp. 46_120_T64]